MALDDADLALVRDAKEEFGEEIKNRIIDGTPHKEAVAAAIDKLKRSAAETTLRAKLEGMIAAAAQSLGTDEKLVSFEGKEVEQMIEVVLKKVKASDLFFQVEDTKLDKAVSDEVNKGAERKEKEELKARRKERVEAKLKEVAEIEELEVTKNQIKTITRTILLP